MMNGILYVLLVILAGLVIILCVMALLVWLLPRHFAERYNSRYAGLKSLDIAKLESETRTAMVQLAVGLAGFFVLYTAVQSIETTNKNLNLTAQGQLADRFSKAVALVSENDGRDTQDGDQKVDPGLVARVGGVYALDSIVESDGGGDYLKPSIHVLAAMIRRESRRGSSGSSCSGLDDTNPYAVPATHETLEPDVDAALKVIRRQVALGIGLGGELNLSHTDLCVAFLPGAKLAGVQLRNSDLRGAILDGADLTRAALSEADMTGAHLPNVQLEGATLWKTTLDRADLSCSDLSKADLEGASLVDANLSWADLESARNLMEEELSGACHSKGTRPPLLPSGLNVHECGSAEHTRELRGRESMWKAAHEPLFMQQEQDEEVCPRVRE